MTFLVPTTEQARAGLRAIKSTLVARGGVDPAQREAIAAVQKHLLHTDFDLDSLPPIEPVDLAIAVEDRALREQLVNTLVTFTLLGDEVETGQADIVDAYADALGVAPTAVRQLRSLAEGRLLLLRFDSLRKGPGPAGLRRTVERNGLVGAFRNMLGFAGLSESPEIAARYRALESYPTGSLGRALFDFYTSRGFAFPGEKGGAPEGLLNHDISHILGGYDTDVRGEGHVLSFQAGYQRENPFGTLIFVLVQGQHGVRLTPLADAYRGFLQTPHLVTEMVEAFARGARMNIDLMDGWDYWQVMREQVSELRRRYNISEPAPSRVEPAQTAAHG